MVYELSFNLKKIKQTGKFVLHNSVNECTTATCNKMEEWPDTMSIKRKKKS